MLSDLMAMINALLRGGYLSASRKASNCHIVAQEMVSQQ